MTAPETAAQPAAGTATENTSAMQATPMTEAAPAAEAPAAEAPATMEAAPAAEVHTEAAPVAAEGEAHTTQDAAHGATDAHAGELHAGTEAHGGKHSGVFPPFDPASFGTQLIWLAIAFAFLYVVMSRMALPRIGGILADRKARIDGDLAAADASRQKTDAAIAAYEAALAAARQKSHAIAEETRNGIKADINTKRVAVEADLGKKLSEAEARIQSTKTEALSHVGEIAADTVQALVSQLTGPVSADEARKAVAAAAKE